MIKKYQTDKITELLERPLESGESLAGRLQFIMELLDSDILEDEYEESYYNEGQGD